MKKLRNFGIALASLAVVVAPALGLLPGGVSTPQAAASTAFQAGHIIDDNIFENSSALNTTQIQTFLNDMINSVGGCAPAGSKSTNPLNGACLNQYVENTTTLQNNFSNPSATISGGISAAQIIYNAGQKYRINPEVLIVMLQKEQGLVTDYWPWYSEYQHAMGYACPDTSGCSSNYADFYKQVDSAAWQLRYYLDHPGAFNYWLGNNDIAYAPSPCTSHSTVDIVNAATAALYIYTPYQPDSSVLANTNPIGSSYGPGPDISSGDSCATYGNRNFWWYFNTWFGPTIDTSVSLAKLSGSNTVYVLYDGQKQGIPTPDVLESWGLSGLPVDTLDSSVFNAIPTASTTLTRYAANSKDGKSYFADNGSVYYVSANDAQVWGFAAQASTHISSTLVNFANYRGEIHPFVSVSGSSVIYAVDNGSLHGIGSATLYSLWGGPSRSNTVLSSTYFNTMPNDGNISSPLLTHSGTTYVANNGTFLAVNSALAATLPASWIPKDIGDGLYNRYASSASLQYMVKGSGQAIYLLDNGTRRGFPDPDTYHAYQSSGSSNTSTISDDLLNYIPSGTPIKGNIITTGGAYYIAYKGLHLIPAALQSAYNIATTANVTLVNNYQNIIPVSSQPATAFAGTAGSYGIYFLDEGRKLPFSNPSTYLLLGGGGVTTLTNYSMNALQSGPIMRNYISDGTMAYLVDGGHKLTVPSADIAQAWHLDNPITVSAATSATFAAGGVLSQHIQLPNGLFCLVDDGQGLCAGSMEMIHLWGLTSNVLHPSQQLLDQQGIHVTGLLQRFALNKVTGATLLTADQGALLGIRNMDNAKNLGFTGKVSRLSPTTIATMRGGNWQGYLAQDDEGTHWVLDGGTKHKIPSSLDTAWTSAATLTLLGDDYLSLLPSGAGITGSIKTSSSSVVYGLKDGVRYGFPSHEAYTSSGLVPYTTVTDSLLNSIPAGGIWH